MCGPKHAINARSGGRVGRAFVILCRFQFLQTVAQFTALRNINYMTLRHEFGILLSKIQYFFFPFFFLNLQFILSLSFFSSAIFLSLILLSFPTSPYYLSSSFFFSALKEYGHLLGTPEAEAFSARVYDIHEWLATRLDDLPATPKLDLCVAVQDPCHQRHVQRVHDATRAVLAPYVHKIIELDDDGLCCGAGGAFSVLHPQLATDIRDRKVDAIERVSPDIVASANPGCSLHLAAGGVEVVHPMQLIDQALHQRT